MKLSVIEKILIVATVILLFLSGSTKTKSPPVQTQPQSQPTRSAPLKETNLGLTVSEFRQAYEELVAEYAVLTVSISETYTKGNTIFFYLNKSVAIMLETEGADSEIKKITVSCEPDKYSNSRNIIERAAIAYSIVIEILSPELTAEERFNILEKMELSQKIKHALTLNGDIIYKADVYNGILMLSAEPK